MAHYTTAEALMHACLAHAAPEVGVLDGIIASSSSPALPRELLLMVRTYLVPAIASDLVDASHSALHAYEESLRSLLCPECRQYNEEIYGGDVWEWEGFTGPCGCRDAGDIRRTNNAMLNSPTRFRDPHHWLEQHLSQSVMAAAAAASSSSSSSTSQTDIWSFASAIFAQYDCELVRHIPATHAHFSNLTAWNNKYGLSPYSSPLEPLSSYILIRPTGDPAETDSDSICDDHTRRWRDRLTLQRLHRNLGIPFFTSTASASPSTKSESVVGSMDLRFGSPRSQSSLTRHDHDLTKASYSTGISLHPVLLSHVLANTAAFCFAAPVALLTVCAKVLCYYTSPGALRVF